MESRESPERTPPVQFVRGYRAFRQFKNPPQPHMCIQDTIKETTEKLYINVLGWQKIANPKHYLDPIPLYGGMQVAQGCGANSNRSPMLVFAVMVNPDILKANGKNAPNPTDREALVSLLCDFVEAMNPGLALTRKPVILKDRDLAGELKDVWLTVQNKRERDKGVAQDFMYKVYDIDGIGNEEVNDEGKPDSPRNGRAEDGSPQKSANDKKSNAKSYKQTPTNHALREVEYGMNNTEEVQNVSRDYRCGPPHTSYNTPVYGPSGENRNNLQTNNIQLNPGEHTKLNPGEHTKPSTSFRKEWNTVHGKTTEGWDEFSKRNMSTINTEPKDNRLKELNGAHYDFFPVFDNKSADSVATPVREEMGDSSSIIVEPMQKLVLHATDNKICDNKSSVSSVGS